MAYGYVLLFLITLYVLGMLGLILYFRDRRLHPYRTRTAHPEEPDFWGVLDEMDREDW